MRRTPVWRRPNILSPDAPVIALFTSGVFIAAGLFLQPAAVYFVLCFTNLALIERWEQGIGSHPGWPTLIVPVIAPAFWPNHSPWFHGTRVSGVGLAVLDFYPRGLSMDAGPAIADMALMRPLLFW